MNSIAPYSAAPGNYPKTAVLRGRPTNPLRYTAFYAIGDKLIPTGRIPACFIEKQAGTSSQLGSEFNLFVPRTPQLGLAGAIEYCCKYSEPYS